MFSEFWCACRENEWSWSGHTGGTIDKLESIKGYQVERSQEDFIRQVQDIGVSVIGQSDQLVKADKALYALRDVTATVDTIPLICEFGDEQENCGRGGCYFARRDCR